MSNTQQILEEGRFAYSAHALAIQGTIADVFMGKWDYSLTKDARVLLKFPADYDVDDGELMCVIRLKEPLPIQHYAEFNHPRARALIKSLDQPVEMVLLPADMVCTFPDYL